MRKYLFFLLWIQTALFAHQKNSVIVTENSVETLNWMHTFIDEAKESIELSSYSVGGQVFGDVLGAIEKRLVACPALKVTIVVSPLILSDCFETIKALEKKFKSRFQLQRASPHFSMSPDYSTRENHIKLLVIDEKYFIVGGTNLHEMCCSLGDIENPIPDSFLADGTRDMDVICRGDCAKELRKVFFDLFAFWQRCEATDSLKWENIDSHYFPVNGKTEIPAFEKSPSRIDVGTIEVVFGNPCFYPNAITAKYEELVQEAKKEIFIANFYFNPAETLFEKLAEAGRRKVALKVITNGLWEKSPGYASLICWANRINYLPMFGSYSNLAIFEYRVPGILYHKKVMVVDGKKTFIGSFNLNAKSDYCDFELNLLIDSEKVAKKMLDVIEKDKKLSTQVTEGEAKNWFLDPLVSYYAALQKLFQGFL